MTSPLTERGPPMYSKRVISSLFSTSPITVFYKNGVEVARKANGILRLVPTYHAPVELTRAKGYKYWGKHFADRACYGLPLVLQEAVEKEPTTHGRFFNKRHDEWWGYEG